MARADGTVIIDTSVDTKGIKSGTSKIEGMFNKTISAAKKVGAAIAAAFAIKKIIDFSKACIELGSDLEEVQNVVDVTFGEMSNVINDWAKNAAVQFGMSELSAKQYTSTIGAMLKSMGFSTDAAAEMSVKMAELAGDMASFYNLDTDEAFQKIRSGISGETEPLKQLGINLSEANLEQYRLSQGIEVSYRNMSQMDKALLRYNYLLSVTSDAQGDFARTSGSWANQMKVLKLQIQSIMADLGKGLINLLTPVLKMINTLLQGLAKLASAFKAFTALITGQSTNTATSVGSGVADSAADYTSAADAAADYADAQDAATDSTKRANKEARKYTSSLDSIHKFQEASSSDTSGGGGKTKTPTSAQSGQAIPTTAIDFGTLTKGDTVVDKLAQKMKAFYNYILKATEPVRKSLSNLWENGLKKLGNFAGKALEDFYNNFLKPVGKWVMGTGLPRFIDAFNEGLMKIDFDKINNALNDVWEQLAPFATKIGEGLLWFWENVLVPLGTWVYNEVVPRFLDAVATVLRILNAVLEAVQPILKWFWEDFLIPIAKWTGGVILKVWDAIIAVLKKFAKWCEDHIKTMHDLADAVKEAWKKIKETVINTCKNIKSGVEDFLKGVKTVWTTGWTTVKTLATTVWGAISKTISTAWNGIKTVTTNVWNSIKSGLSTVWNGIRSSASTVFNAVKTGIGNVWNGIRSTASSAWSGIKATLSTTWSNIKSSASTAFSNVKSVIESAWNSTKTKTSNVWGGIKTTITNVISAIVEKAKNMKTTITTSFVDAFRSVVKLIKTPINGVISAINGVIKGIVTGINAMIRALNSLHFDIPSWVPALGGKRFGLNIPTIINYPQIPRLAQGAVIPPNAPFAAVLGDQRRGMNIEAPENLIRKIVREEGGGNNRYEFKAVLNRRVLFDEVINEARLRQQLSAANPFDLA